MPGSLRRFFRFPLIIIPLAPFILYAPILLTGKAVFWGTPITQFVPWWMQAWKTILAGDLPLWNPLNGMGAPLLANYQSALLYPPTWLYFLLAALGGVGALAWGQALLIALHLAWSGMGMASVARRLGWGELSQVVSGLAFGLSGYLVARAHFLSINMAAAWLPWILLAAYDLAAEKTGNKGIFKLALLIGLQLLAGHAQIAWYTLLLASVWAAFWGWQSDHWQGLKNIGLRFSASVALGFALAAVQLLPTSEYLLQSQRAAAVEFDYAMVYSFWPWRFLTLLAPNFFGSPVSGDHWGYQTFWEDAVYIGLLPLLLALAAVFRRVKTRIHARITWFMVGVAVIAFALALGDNTPFYPWLYRNIPTFDLFQAPARFTIWAVFALALLAGLGVEGWRRPQGWALYWGRLGTAGAFSVLLGAGLGWYLFSNSSGNMGEAKPTIFPALALAGLIGVGIGIINLIAPAKDQALPSKKWVWMVVVLVSIDMLAAGWGLNPGTDLSLYTASPANTDEIRDLAGSHRIYISQEQEFDLKYERFLSYETFELEEAWLNMRAVLLPNSNLLDGISSANNFDPFIPGRYARWMKKLDNTSAQIQAQMLTRMDVAVVEHIDPDRAFGVRFDQIGGGARLRWLPCAQFAQDGDAALDFILSGELDPQEIVVLEAEGSEISPCNNSQDVEVRLLAEGANFVTAKVEALQDGWLVLADVWYPGWVVKVDGESGTLLRADYLFRGVEVPAGSHTVEFIYRPTSFYFGASIGIIAWLFLGFGWQRKRS
ncbi:MAG: YfhO family protein [Chloroflexi bacterium]|nr:YfhO family protein [Chloroflexota bacterium]